MQFTVSFVDLPQTCKHASVFVAVRVTQHDLLLPVPGIEQGRVARAGPELTTHSRAGTEVLNGLEERHGHESGIVLSRGHLHTADGCKPHHVEYVLSGSCTADYVGANCVGGILTLELRDSPHGIKHHLSVVG